MHEQTLLPGAYAEEKLTTRDQQKLRIPASALAMKSSGTFVAAIDSQSSIQIKAVQLGRDFGTEVEITAGLQGDESLVVNPPDELSSGDQVSFTSLGAE